MHLRYLLVVNKLHKKSPTFLAEDFLHVFDLLFIGRTVNTLS